MIRLRPAALSDVHALARLWHSSWHAGHAHLKEVQPCLLEDRSLEIFAEQTPKHITNGGCHLIAEHVDGQLLGFASVESAEVTQIFVEPTVIGQGLVGVPLLSAAEALLLDVHGDGVVACVHALAANEKACTFYRKHGWREAGCIETKIETTIKRPGALHAVRFDHPWKQLRFEKQLSRQSAG